MKSDPNHICGICVKLKSLLKAHYKKVNKRISLKELDFNKAQARTYSCLLCAKNFANRHLLKEHLINHPVSGADKPNVKIEIIQDEPESKYAPSEEELETIITTSSRGRRIKKTARKIRVPSLNQISSISGNNFSDDDEENYETDFIIPKEGIKKEKDVVKKRKKSVPKRVKAKKPPKVLEDSGPQTCVICNETFPQLNELHIHMLDHTTTTQDGPITCNLCHHEFKEKKKLINHLRLTHGPRSHKCDHCDFTTNYANTLKVHIENKHTKTYKPTSVRNPEDGLLHCHLCDMKFEKKR